MPLEWEEIEACLKKEGRLPCPSSRPTDALRRVEKKGDLFARVLTLKQEPEKSAGRFSRREKQVRPATKTRD